jgi:TetR/AcrR family tetracycline transcriptional repressor
VSPESRPVRPALSRDYIIRTALSIIDRDGIAKLSMRRLGTELGADPMAIYYYLPNKSALFDGVVEAVYSEIDLDGVDLRAPWQEQIAQFMRRIRAAVRRHPNALPVLSTRPAYMPKMFEFGEYALGVLGTAGFGAQLAIDMINCLGTFTIGHVLAEVGEPVGGATATAEEVAASVPAGAYPRLAKAFADGYEYRPDQQYELGLRALLDGFARLL